MPEISVIIPAFNAERTIGETVTSVLSQTFVDFEVLVINDGSTDHTLDILTQVQDDRVRILTFPNAGVAESRNRGIQAARGKFLAFLDSDDLWTPTKLAEQRSALEANPQAAVAYSWNDYINEHGKFFRHGSHPTYVGDVYEALFQGSFIENGSNILVRQQAVDSIGNFDPTLVPTEDWDFYLRLAEKYSFVCVPKVHVLYRMVPSSLSNRVLRMERSGLTVLKRVLAKHPDRLLHLRSSSFSDYYSYLFYKAFIQASGRRDWLQVLQILARGVGYAPSTLNLVAKRRILRAVRGLVLGS